MDILGVDIGGTGLKAAVVDTTIGALKTERVRIPTPEERTPEEVLPAVVELIEQMNHPGPVGIGFPAVVQKGVPKTPFTAYQIKSWVGYPVAEKLSQLCDRPVFMLNDADAAGIAEIRFGRGKDVQGIVLLLTLGTGIGSGLFIDGQLMPNSELGHLYLKHQDFVAERYCSEKIRIDEDLSWKKWAKRLDQYLYHLDRVFSPDLIILGGGASKQHKKFVPRLTVPVTVVPAQLGNEAGIIGAALYAKDSRKM